MTIFKREYSREQQADGEQMPKCYGVSYMRRDCAVFVLHVIPLNLVVALWVRIYRYIKYGQIKPALYWEVKSLEKEINYTENRLLKTQQDLENLINEVREHRDDLKIMLFHHEELLERVRDKTT